MNNRAIQRELLKQTVEPERALQNTKILNKVSLTKT